MRPAWTQLFIASAGGILLVAALSRFLIVTENARILAGPDFLLGLPLRQAVLLVGAMECGVALVCLCGRQVRLQSLLLVWLATNFMAYRLGLFAIGCQPQVTAIGSLTDPLHFARGFFGCIFAFLPFYLVLGSCAVVAGEFLRKETKRINPPAEISKTVVPQAHPPAHVRFLKIRCPACGEHIEYPTNFFGEQIPCPHCRAIITLQKPMNVKMTCPACAGHLEFPDYALGQKILCPHCQTEITLKKTEILKT
jgi:ribosomal protein S27E